MKVSGWTRPKTLWEEIICNLCDTKKVENEKHYVRLTSYAHTASQFHNICNTIDLHNLLTNESQKDPRNFISNIFYQRNKRLKQMRVSFHPLRVRL